MTSPSDIFICQNMIWTISYAWPCGECFLLGFGKRRNRSHGPVLPLFQNFLCFCKIFSIRSIKSISGLPPQQTGKIVQIEEAKPEAEAETSPLPPDRQDDRGEKPSGEKTFRRRRRRCQCGLRQLVAPLHLRQGLRLRQDHRVSAMFKISCQNHLCCQNLLLPRAF